MMIKIVMKGTIIQGTHNVYCGRGSPLGNPFVMENKSIAERNRVCDMYEGWFKEQANRNGSPVRNEMLRLLQLVKSGASINLQCFCKDEIKQTYIGRRCHCDTIRTSLMQHL